MRYDGAGESREAATDDVTFELVQRMVLSLLGRLGEGHRKGGSRPTYIPSAYFSAHWPHLQILTPASLCLRTSWVQAAVLVIARFSQ